MSYITLTFGSGDIYVVLPWRQSILLNYGDDSDSDNDYDNDNYNDDDNDDNDNYKNYDNDDDNDDYNDTDNDIDNDNNNDTMTMTIMIMMNMTIMIMMNIDKWKHSPTLICVLNRSYILNLSTWSCHGTVDKTMDSPTSGSWFKSHLDGWPIWQGLMLIFIALPLQENFKHKDICPLVDY